MQIVIDIPKEEYEEIINSEDCGLHSLTRAIAKGTPFQEIYNRENLEIKNEIKNLSKRVETLEEQKKIEMEEQIKKLKAEIDYAKFRCALPNIIDMMSHN